MNTLKVEATLAKRYKYKPLPDDLSGRAREWYKQNIPAFITEAENTIDLFTASGTLVCHGYDRIVIGDYGAFIEFSEPATELIIAPGQEYRVDDPKYSKNVKYIWLTAQDNSHIKVYKQRRTVSYADYKPGKYYVSVHEVWPEGGQCADNQ